MRQSPRLRRSGSGGGWSSERSPFRSDASPLSRPLSPETPTSTIRPIGGGIRQTQEGGTSVDGHSGVLMKLPMLDTRSALAPLMENLFAENDEREPNPLSTREHVTELTLALLMLVACWAIAGFSSDFGDVETGPAIVLTLTY